MRRFGLIGYPLSHSFSAKYFSDKFISLNISDCEYLNFPIESAEMVRTLFEMDETLQGINVTIPHKKEVIGFLDHVDKTAFEIGAVNVIKAFRNGSVITLKGYNTDSPAFISTLPAQISERGGVALVLGSGGAANAVIYALGTLNIETLVVSRTKRPGTISYTDLNRTLFKRTSIIVNATPLGMVPNPDTFPEIDYNLILSSTLLYDLVYNPAITQFMHQGIKHGCEVINGLKMLETQADMSWEIWNNDVY